MSKAVKPAPAVTNIHLELQHELYRTFDFYNDKYCDSKLPRPVITVATKGRMAAHGWFSHSSWKLKDGVLHEIQMCGESFDREHTHTIGTLIHEMAHLKNFVDNDNKVVDCTPQQRHNKIFERTAKFFGLTVTSSKRFGSAHTEVPADALKIIAEELKPNKELYKLYRDGRNTQKPETKKSKLKPVMVDEETKALIEKGAEQMGLTQKEFTQKAAELFMSLQKRIDETAITIFEKLHTYKSSAEIAAQMTDGLNDELYAPVTEEEEVLDEA